MLSNYVHYARPYENAGQYQEPPIENSLVLPNVLRARLRPAGFLQMFTGVLNERLQVVIAAGIPAVMRRFGETL